MLIYEPHVHSNNSDGKNSVREILGEAIKKGIDLISITDHDTLNGSLEAIEIVNEENLPITVIPGVEVSAKGCHLLIYGIKKEIDAGLEIVDAINEAKKFGGFVVLPHPFEFYRKGCIRLRYFKLVDAVEVFNAKSYLNFLAGYFAKRYRKPMIAGSDAHSIYTIGYGLTLVYTNAKTDQEVFKAIVDGRVKIRGKRIPLKRRIGKT